MVKFADAATAATKKATRAAYGATLAELAAEGLPVVAVDADLSGSTPPRSSPPPLPNTPAASSTPASPSRT